MADRQLAIYVWLGITHVGWLAIIYRPSANSPVHPCELADAVMNEWQ